VWSAAELRRVKNARLDRAQAAIWVKVIGGGELNAVHAFLRIPERWARLNGLDAPTTVSLDRGVRIELEAALTELETLLGEVIAASDAGAPRNGLTQRAEPRYLAEMTVFCDTLSTGMEVTGLLSDDPETRTGEITGVGLRALRPLADARPETRTPIAFWLSITCLQRSDSTLAGSSACVVPT